ncbi:MAG: Holliday junction resolvase RuvX [Candidatus Dormibacteraceae bacterium]
MPGRVLAVDPGTRRVGLALSDESATIASPLRTLAAEPAGTLAARLAVIISEVGAVEVVVGLPVNMDGSAGEAARSARALAGELRGLTRLKVALYDERLSSAAADRHLVASGMRRQRRRQVVDQVAATLILRSYLERRGNG